MRITQLYSAFNGSFSSNIRRKYDMTNYKDASKPVIFFGCYGSQIEKAFSNKSIVKIIWTGSDCPPHMKNPETVKRLKERKNIKHIAISSFIENDLKSVGIEFESVPIVPYPNDDIIPCELGNAVYIYKPTPYGGGYYKMIKKDFPNLEYIETWYGKYKRPEIIELYKKSFVCLRFTKHDGMSNTVIELGLMGRKVFWNGNTPNAINFKSYEDIYKNFITIIDEKKTKQYDPFKISELVKNFISVGDDWLYV